MITVLAYVPIVLSLLLLCAHFFRSGDMLLLAVVAALIPALAIRKAWLARTVQFVLVFGMLEWLRTGMILAAERVHAGAPYQRMLWILGAVAALTMIAALLFQTRTLGTLYNLKHARKTQPPLPDDTA